MRPVLAPLQARADQLLGRRAQEGTWLYRRVLLLDEQGAALAEAELPESPPPSRILFQDHLRPSHRPAALLAADDGSELRLSLALEFKGTYAGQLVVWLNPAVLSGRLRAEANTGLEAAFLAFDGRSLPMAAAPPPVLPAGVLAAYPPVPDVLFPVEPGRRDSGERRYAVLRVPLRMRSLELLAVFNLSSALSDVSPARLLAGLAALGMAILGGAAGLVMLTLRAQVLRARLEESAAQGRRLEEKNRELEAEVGERRQVEVTLATTEREYLEILNAAGVAVIVYEMPAGTILEATTAAARMFGYPPGGLRGISLGELVPEAAASAGETRAPSASAAPAEERLCEWQARRRNGETFRLEASLRRSENLGPSRGWAVLREVSQPKAGNLEGQTLGEHLAQELESSGSLAGGVSPTVIPRPRTPRWHLPDTREGLSGPRD